MKTLNDKIIATLTIGAGDDRYISYYVTENTEANAIFHGLAFVRASTVAQNIDICLNDILRSEAEKINILDSNNTEDIRLIRKYYLISSGKVAVTDDIFLGYRNLLHNYSMDIMKSDSACDGAYSNHFAAMLQGAKYDYNNINKQSYSLYPKYPFIATLNLRFSLLLNVGANTETIEYGLEENGLSSARGETDRETYLLTVDSSLSSLLSGLTYKKNVYISSDAITEHHISGTKLWKVVVNGQNMYASEAMAEFAEHIGYSEYYNNHFYVQEPTEEYLYYAVQTNDPSTDITAVWDEYGDTRFDMVCVEKLSIQNCIMSHSTVRSGLTVASAEYDKFVRFMTSFCSDITEEMINSWGVVEGEAWPDEIQIGLNYIIPEDAYFTLAQWKTDFYAHTCIYLAMSSTGALGRALTLYYTTFFVADSGETGRTQGKTNTYKDEVALSLIKIAELDKCPAKFYLQWRDRFGGVQCLPFSGKSTKSISYNITNIANRYGEKSPKVLENTYNFDINTGWLSDNDYALYESIFVSPELKLYDTENDKSYSVIVADKSFTEKTHKNLKKMFGFNIKLQINTTENLYY